MENQYDVGIANRYALFLEEGENELTAIKKKLTKELRAKNKQEKKENAEAKKTESVKAVEKPKKPEPAPTSDTTSSKKENKENKTENFKGKERKQRDPESIKRDKEFVEKPRPYKNGQSVQEVSENWDDDTNTKTTDSAPPPRKNYDNRKPRERKFDNNDQYQPKNYYNQKKYNKKDNPENNDSGNGDTFTTNENDDWGAKENGFEQPPQNDYKPRGGGNRFRGGNRGGRGGYNNSERGERVDRGDRGDRGERADRGDRSDRGERDRNDRRRAYNDNRFEVKEDNETTKTDTWGEETVENPVENADNHNDETKSDGNNAATNEQKEEVKEVMTLDEWKKIRGEREKPQYNLRKAGEGEDLSQWKNMRELQKEKEKEFLENGYGHHVPKKAEADKENNENVQRVARQKHIDINIHFREPMARGGRGGRVVRNNRFGFRGKNNDERNEGYAGNESRPNRKFRGDRDGPVSGRGGSSRQHAPKITDERDFPTLG